LQALILFDKTSKAMCMQNKLSSTSLIAFVFWCMPMLLCAQLTLTVDIEGLRNSKGRVLLELQNENQKQVAGAAVSISAKQSRIVIENLQPGKYAFKFFHDENNNEKLDTNWLGIPKEGFGFSNNPRIVVGPPSFDKTVFMLDESKIIHCKINYF
jgi:uncharacterized protein (DUF2141 family)